MGKTVNHQQMPKVTFEVSAAQRRLMDAHPEVNWSAVLRQAVERHAASAELARRIEEEMGDTRIQAVARSLKAGAGARWRDEGRR
jgi:hypothetical protein